MTPHLFLVLSSILIAVTAGTEPPAITLQPEKRVFFKEGERVQLPCQASGDPRPSYTWQWNGVDFDPSGSDDHMVQLPNTGTIVVQRPEARDEGIFQCFAQNEFGKTASVKAALEKAVLEDFPVTPDRRLLPSLGDSLTLECVAPKSLPAAEVFWVTREPSGSFSPVATDARVSMDLEYRLRFANVKATDSQNGNAYVCMARNSVLRRNSMGGRHFIFPQGAASQRQVGFLWSSPADSFGLYGQAFRLKCIFSGNPTPDVHWERVDNKSMPQGFRVESFGQELVTDQLQLEDGGEYSCWATNVFTPQRFQRSFQVIVEAEPYFVKRPQNRPLGPGETAEIECKAEGVPSPQVRWFINTIPLGDIMHTWEGLNVTTPRDGVLRFENVSLSQSLVVQCNASNKHGYAWAEAWVHVLQDPAAVTSLPTEVVAVEGRTREIQCLTSGTPKPVVTWFKDDDQSPLVSVNSNGSLILQNASKADEGNYTCRAENTFGSQELTLRVRVVGRTAIVSGPGDLSIVAWQSPVLHCVATADPQDLDELQLRWEKDGVLIPEDDWFQFQQQRDGRVVRGWLALNGLISRDSGTYLCRAQSPHDSAVSAPAQVTVLSSPDSPYIERLQCNEASSSASLTWSAGLENPPVQFFEVEHSREPDITRWTHAARVDAPQTSTTVTLPPNGNYTLRVTSHNALGAGHPSYPSSQCRTPPAVPSHHPSNVRALGSRPDHFYIEWMAMPEWEHNAPGFHYLVTVRKSEESSQLMQAVIDNWRTNFYALPTPGQVYKEYVISVAARNSLGEARQTPTEVLGHTGETEPVVTPTGISVSNITATSAVLTFDFDLSVINASNSLMNGKFHGFKVYSWEEGRRAETLREGVVEAGLVEGAGPGKARVTVQGLAPLTPTQLSLAARNSFYRGPLSNPVAFSTLAAEPGLVEDIRVVRTTSSSLQVRWDPPSFPNGVITDYNLALQQVNGLDLGFLFYVMDGQNVLSATASGLEAGASYRVHVTACNAVGCGQANFIQVSTADAGSDVTRDYDVDETCRDRVRVAWSVSPRDVNDSAIYVRYRLTGAIHWLTAGEEQVRLCADSNDTDVRPWWRVLDNLDPDTSYQIQLVIAPSGRDVITSYVTTVVTPSDETSACSLGDLAVNRSSPPLPVEVCKQEPSTTTATSTSVTPTDTNTTATSTSVINTTNTNTGPRATGPTSLSTQILPSLGLLLLMLMAGMIA